MSMELLPLDWIRISESVTIAILRKIKRSERITSLDLTRLSLPANEHLGLGKTHIPTEEEQVHNPHDIDHEQELFVDRGENQSAGGGNARDPSDGERTPPPTELDKNRNKQADLLFYERAVNPTGFAHCEYWIDNSIRLLSVSPTNEGSFEEISVNFSLAPQSGTMHPPSVLSAYVRQLLRSIRIAGHLRF